MGKETVWVKNLKTGLVWLVDAEHAARLLGSGEYVNAKAQRGTEAQRENAKSERKAKRKDAKEGKGAKGERRGAESDRKGAKKGKGAKEVR